MEFIYFLIIVFSLIVFIRLINEKFIHMQNDIALILFSSLLSIILLVISYFIKNSTFNSYLTKIGNFGFKEYLLDGVVCFMIFAGASKVSLVKFKENFKTISLLSILTTTLSSVIYGLLFFLIVLIFKMNISIWLCLLLGCVVSPTDPIAATGILKKLGLSKNVTSVIESESLFNDGIGVALFLFIKNILCDLGSNNFLLMIIKEIFGALFLSLIISFIFFKLLSITKKPSSQIIISILCVSLCYSLCELLGFSGIIASVVCGMYFSYMRNKKMDILNVVDTNKSYENFWNTMEDILNSILFVMIGISLLSINISKYIWIIIPCAIIIGFVSRYVGVLVAALINGKKKIPGKYTLNEYSILMTWTGLKGGLSLALAMSSEAFLSNNDFLITINIAYITIFFTTIVQGLTTKYVYLQIENHKCLRIRRESEAVENNYCRNE